MSQSSIDYDQQQNIDDLEQYGHASVYTDSVNWDTPGRGHIEVQVRNVEPPPEWGESPKFSMFMHINCGGDPSAVSSSTTNRPPN